MERKHGQGFEWPPARVNMLLVLKSRGYSASQIAKQIGNGLTRSAVIGKLNRMGITRAAATKKRSLEDARVKAAKPDNKGKVRGGDISPPELLSVRRFSWEAE